MKVKYEARKVIPLLKGEKGEGPGGGEGYCAYRNEVGLRKKALQKTAFKEKNVTLTGPREGSTRKSTPRGKKDFTLTYHYCALQ